jgi:hypothetical protein
VKRKLIFKSYSSICSAIGTLRGALHGGANEAAYDLISSFKNPEDAEKGILEMLKKKTVISNFLKIFKNFFQWVLGSFLNFLTFFKTQSL